MTVYHGSTVVVKNPDAAKSKKYLDFGKGFYVTALQAQAERWALRKKLFSANDSVGIVNVYELGDLAGCNHLQFFDCDAQWLDFVCRCRKGEDVFRKYDVISGAVADDQVFKCVDMFFKGIWNEERTIHELKFYERSNQICFVNQSVLDKKLHFSSYYEVQCG